MGSTVLGVKGDGWVSIDTSELPWHVEVYVRTVDGSPQVLGLRLEPPKEGEAMEPQWRVRDLIIDNAALRRLRLGHLRKAASRMRALDLQQALAALRPDVRRPAQPFAPGHFERVADVYREAVEAGDPPLPAIMARWHVARPTASKWVRKAREEGLLGWPQRTGVAGTEADSSPWAAN